MKSCKRFMTWNSALTIAGEHNCVIKIDEAQVYKFRIEDAYYSTLWDEDNETAWIAITSDFLCVTIRQLPFKNEAEVSIEWLEDYEAKFEGHPMPALDCKARYHEELGIEKRHKRMFTDVQDLKVMFEN